jgi:hypothetical protein
MRTSTYFIHNAFKKLNSRPTFEDYLAKNHRYRGSYFHSKEQSFAAGSCPRKKRRRAPFPSDTEGSLSTG